VEEHDGQRFVKRAASLDELAQIEFEPKFSAVICSLLSVRLR
jgi:hypothetical protein